MLVFNFKTTHIHRQFFNSKIFVKPTVHNYRKLQLPIGIMGNKHGDLLILFYCVEPTRPTGEIRCPVGAFSEVKLA